MTLPKDETKRKEYIDRREGARKRVFTDEHRKNLAEANRKRAEQTPSKKVKVVCDHCGKEFECYPSGFVKSVNHYCSHECSTNARKGKKIKYKNGDKHPNTGVPRPQEVRDKISVAQIGKEVSEETRRKISATRKRVERVALECPTCHNIFTMSQAEFKRGGKYCSRKCMVESDEWRRKISESKMGKTDPEETRKKKSESHKGEKNHNYGKNFSEESRKRMSISKKGMYSLEKHPRWKGGVSFEPYCTKFNDHLKERVREFFGRVCLLCGKHENENMEKLSVHHVYAEKKACCEGDICSIHEMDELRKLFPKEIARFGEQEFSDDELIRIRMMVPLCRVCHLKTMSNGDEEYYTRFFDNLIMEKYGGKCYYTEEEYKEILNSRNNNLDASLNGDINEDI